LEKERVVQRFEYTLELEWETIKDYLEESGVVLTAFGQVRDLLESRMIA
jgi:hypothetical protein